MGQEAVSSLFGCLWLRVSRDILVHLLVGASVISRSEESRKVSVQDHSCDCRRWQLLKALDCGSQFLVTSCGSLHKVVHNVAAGFHQSDCKKQGEIERDKERKRETGRERRHARENIQEETIVFVA